MALTIELTIQGQMHILRGMTELSMITELEVALQKWLRELVMSPREE